jgi:hypothetical protein
MKLGGIVRSRPRRLHGYSRGLTTVEVGIALRGLLQAIDTVLQQHAQCRLQVLETKGLRNEAGSACLDDFPYELRSVLARLHAHRG